MYKVKSCVVDLTLAIYYGIIEEKQIGYEMHTITLMEYKLNVSHESITMDVTDELIHSITGCVFLTHRGELLISKKSGGFMEIVGVDNESIVFQTFENKRSLCFSLFGFYPEVRNRSIYDF